MRFKHAQLDNGLTVVAEINPEAASMAAGFFVRTGSRDETPEIAGTSHFLEHMMFKGTARRTAFDVNREFDEMGASYNAFTSEENTVYYGAVLPQFQERLLDLLGDMLRPALRQEDFDVEKHVILDEIALYQDMPRWRVYEALMTQYFAGHPLGHSILGTNESIQALRREQMLDYFNRRYSPGNITVIGVGNVDFDAFVDKTRRMTSHWTPYDVGRDTPRFGGTTSRTVQSDEKVAREHIGFLSPAPSRQDSSRYAADLLAAILGDDTGSRLYYALVDTALADEAGTGLHAMDGTGAFVSFISCDAENASKAVTVFHDEIRKLLDEGPTESEMTAAKNKIASAATLKGEVPMGRLTAVGFDWVYRGLYEPLAEQIETLFAVTRDEVMAVAREYDLSKTSMLALGPVKEI
jgi:predicted Zn-dependent peptidase